jgi:extradiol dioxygenase family protein
MKTLLFFFALMPLTLIAQVNPPANSPDKRDQERQVEIKPFFCAIIVHNVDSSQLWYSRNLQLQIRNRVDVKGRGIRQVVLENNSKDLQIELIELKSVLSATEALKGTSPDTRLSGHFKVGFQVDDFDFWYQQLSQNKVQFKGDVIKDPVSNKRTMLTLDPDGNIIQFFEK